MLALGALVDVLVVDPAVAVGADFVAIGQQRLHRPGVALHRHPDRENGNRNLVGLKQSLQPPHPDPAAVLVDRLHADVPHVFACVRSDDLGEK